MPPGFVKIFFSRFEVLDFRQSPCFAQVLPEEHAFASAARHIVLRNAEEPAMDHDAIQLPVIVRYEIRYLIQQWRQIRECIPRNKDVKSDHAPPT